MVTAVALSTPADDPVVCGLMGAVPATPSADQGIARTAT